LPLRPGRRGATGGAADQKRWLHANGLTCADCQGGGRSAKDPGAARNPTQGFLGKPVRTAFPNLCARAVPAVRTSCGNSGRNSVSTSLSCTSVHGKRLAAGDDTVTPCIDCHSVHNIRPVKDALAPVHPLRLPET
jgi:hypothetical protein